MTKRERLSIIKEVNKERMPIVLQRFCLCLVTLLVSTVGGSAAASPVTYCFNDVQFGKYQQTPFNKVAPESGPPEFLASFTTQPDSRGFFISPFPSPQPIIDGPALVDPADGSIDVLTITTNQPIDQVQLGFAILNAGSLKITTPTGTSSETGSNVGGIFLGGTLQFKSEQSFTTFTLEAIDTNGKRMRFGIDNLVMNSITALEKPSEKTVSCPSTNGLPTLKSNMPERKTS
jgi:hypothetical protein